MEKLIEAKSHLTQAMLPKNLEAKMKAKSLKALNDERTSVGIDENTKSFTTKDKILLVEEDT
jgi:hypothetical protein